MEGTKRDKVVALIKLMRPWAR